MIAFLYTSNKQLGFEIKTLTFPLTPKKNEILRCKSNKIYVQDQYEENYKTLMKEFIKINGKIFYVHG